MVEHGSGGQKAWGSRAAPAPRSAASGRCGKPALQAPAAHVACEGPALRSAGSPENRPHPQQGWYKDTDTIAHFHHLSLSLKPQSTIRQCCTTVSGSISCYGSRQDLTSPLDRVLCLMRIAHASLLSDTTNCPTVTSKPVIRQNLMASRGPK